MSPKLIASIVAVSAIAIAATPASAGDHVAFSFNSSELRTANGAQNLHTSLMAKAEQVCTTAGRRSISDKNFEQQCTDQLANEFVAKIDHPRLDHVHNATQGSVRVAKRR